MENKKIQEHFEKGLQFFREGSYAQALQEFKIVKILLPTHTNIDYYLNATQKKIDEIKTKLEYFMEEEFDNNIVILSNSLQYATPKSFSEEIVNLLKLGDYNKALHKISEAEPYVGDSRKFLLLKASIQKRLGLFNDSENTLIKANKLFPNDLEILNSLASLYIIKNSLSAAYEYLSIALALDPNNPYILNNLGVYYMHINQLDKAREMFQKALKLHPQNKLILKNLNNLNQKIESLENEIYNLRKEYFSHPSYIDLALKLAQCLINRGYLYEAKHILTEIIEKKENYTEAHYYLGYCYEVLGEFEKAIKHYQKVAILQNHNEIHLFQNIDSLIKEGYLEEALNEIKKIAVLEIDQASSYIKLGKSYFEDALWQKALTYFLKAIDISNNYADAHYWAAMCYLQLGKRNKAKHYLINALDINPNYSDAHFQIGLIYRKMSSKKAITHLKKAIECGLKEPFVKIAQEMLKSLNKSK